MEELKSKVLHADAPRPSDLRKENEPIDDLVIACLAKSKADRPELREVRSRLASLLGSSYSQSLNEFAVTRNTRRTMVYIARLATVHARVDAYEETLRYLRDLQQSFSDQGIGELSEELADLGQEVEMYQGQSVSLSEVVERFQDIEHTVQTL